MNESKSLNQQRAEHICEIIRNGASESDVVWWIENLIAVETEKLLVYIKKGMCQYE
jgi:hypothetical protein